ncbi:MAG: 4-oxalocrotonate tautomerase [Mycobacterium sp.]
MPFYNCACSRDLGDDTQARIADVIGAVHCGLTGAPLHFVNVLFLKAYRLRRGEVLSVIGNVRTGGNRTPELIDRLRGDLQASIAAVASLAPTEVVVKLISIEAKWVMEGGRVIPEPGEEEEREMVVG